jgi:HEAT repeat protein
VEPNAQGQIQIVVDETRQRVLSGRLDDEKIRRLLLSAAKDPSDPGLRVESVDILKGNSDSADVRSALVAALLHDSNAGVRLKALEGLKSFAGDSEVRKALSQALLSDTNPGVRTQAIDLLTQNKGRPPVGVLQELLAREDNSYVRQSCQKALREMNASEQTY